MKIVQKHRRGLPFLLTLLMLFSVFVPSSFAEGYTMRVLQRMEELPANKVFSVRFNDVPDLNHILQKKGSLLSICKIFLKM